MFFLISKMTSLFTDPVAVILLILVASAALALAGRRRWAWCGIGAAIGIMTIMVPYTRVSATELQVLLDENLLRRAGRFDIVVKNPDPAAPLWGDGTSNKAHLLVNFKY